MATVLQWSPFGVSLDLTATAGTVTRISATQYTVILDVAWETHWSGANTNYGMTASSGGNSISLATANKYNEKGSGSFTGTYSISGNASAATAVTVTFTNYSPDGTKSASKDISLSVTVPAWTSYTVSYNANGGSNAPGSQTKWKDQTLTLSTQKPTRTGYTFLGWSTSSTASSATYGAGDSYTANAAITLYAVWQVITYTVSYNANGGSGAPGSQTKTYGVNLTLSSVKPTKTNYNFKGWALSAGSATVSYGAGGTYTANASATLYAVWELAYTSPRITGLTINRCDSDGTAKNDGTCAAVSFSWACDYTVSTVKIEWGAAGSGVYGSSTSVSASGTSGTVSQTVGAEALSAASSYDFRITVSDSSGKTERTYRLSTADFTIYARQGGKGVAFGKASEKENRVETAWDLEMNGHFLLSEGAAYFGMGGGSGDCEPPVAADLDTAIRTGWYVTTASTANLPANRTQFQTAVLRVETRYDVVYQTLLTCSNVGVYQEIKRYRDGNGWHPWEWVNPPMLAGEEYRTTERYNGKPVYVKLIAFGALPNAATKDVRFYDDTTSRPISVTAQVGEGYSYLHTTLPLYDDTARVAAVNYNTIRIVTTYDRSDLYARAVIKYWKTTD